MSDRKVDVSEVLKAAQAGAAAVRSIHDAAHAIVRAIDDLKRQKLKIVGAPDPTSVLIATMSERIDAAHKHWCDTNVGRVIHAFTSRITFDKTDESKITFASPKGFSPSESETAFDLFCGIAPELVKSTLTEIIQRRPSDDEQKPVRDRLADLERIDLEIQRLEDGHTELVDTAAALDPPIKLKMLPEVANRRKDAENAKSRAPQANAEPQSNGSRQRTAPSNYFASQG